MSVVIAADEPHGSRLIAVLGGVGVEIELLVRPSELLSATSNPHHRAHEALREADTVVLHATRSLLVADVVALCDRSGTRIVALADRASERRAAASFGIADPLPSDASGPDIRDAISAPAIGSAGREVSRGSVAVVWGPHGAPGRTTVALALAAASAATGHRVALIDADTHAPSIAQRLALSEEAPGFPIACRQTDYGLLDGAELTRLSVPVDIDAHPIEVLAGINRPSRWPELTAARVQGALDTARGWVDRVIVDVAAPLDADEIVTSDVDVPRRNQASLAAIAEADTLVTLGTADPVGIARLVRGLARLDEIAPRARRVLAVNRMRSGPLGLDAERQVTRALEQLADARSCCFLPDDPRAADRALLASEPILPRRRAPFAHAISKLAATL
jgi:Mrp family chromosome partitioning ATPase